MPPSRLSWIKLYTDILDDPVLGPLSVSAKWRFIELLLLAGQCDAEGYLVDGEQPYTDSDLAWRFRISEEQIQLDLQQLSDAGLIFFDEDTWLVPNFSKRQGRSQDEKRERWREQKRRQRAAKLALELDPETPRADPMQEINMENVLHVRADIADNVHPVRALEEDKEEDINKEEYIEENHHQAEPVKVLPNRNASFGHHQPEPGKVLPGRNGSSGNLSGAGIDRPNSNSSPRMMMKNSSSTDYFCDSFGLETLTPEQYNTLRDLEIHYGPELLCKVIDWAASREIHPNRAVISIRTAIADWQDKPKTPIHTRGGYVPVAQRAVFDQVRRDIETGKLRISPRQHW